MGKLTTLKSAALSYREVGGNGEYTPLMGVLKGLQLAQDTPDETSIDAEFFDVPFAVLRTGKPIKITFELANYDLTELIPLCGGSIDEVTGDYIAPSTAVVTEHEYKLDFQYGLASLVVFKGSTVLTLKKDQDGALNYTVEITSLAYNDGTNDLIYKLVKEREAVTLSAVSTSSSGYSNKNPKTEGWFEKDGSNDTYRLTWDTTPVDGKTYYKK